MVLPPASPKKNGGVERGNRIVREALYAMPSFSESISDLRKDLDAACAKYNNYRPHRALDGLTPKVSNYPNSYIASRY